MADAGEATGTPQAVRVKRELLEAFMTCPICNKLLNEATAISECLHTFCRKCIFEKLTDKEVDCCPLCDIDLGCVPVEKLRDGGLPVSFIQKYLVKKLNLATEAEVEIKCQHQPVNPMLALYNLIDMWVQKGLHVGDSDEVLASVGTSAKEFVMVLTYSLRAPAP